MHAPQASLAATSTMLQLHGNVLPAIAVLGHMFRNTIRLTVAYQGHVVASLISNKTIVMSFSVWPFNIKLSHSIAILLLSLLFVAILLLVHDFYTWQYLPPGPPPLPFIGNKLSLPRSKPWLQFQEWSKQYGAICTIWIGRKPTLVVSDPEVAAELMEKRSSKYSSRP